MTYIIEVLRQEHRNNCFGFWNESCFLRFFFQFEDVSPKRVEFLFKTRLGEWIAAVG